MEMAPSTSTPMPSQTTTIKPAMTSEGNPDVCNCPEVDLSPTISVCKVCTKRDPYDTNFSTLRESPFAPLTEYEMGFINKIMITKRYISTSKNIAAKRAGHMFLLVNEKEKILDYLDHNGTFPGRYAKVIVMRGQTNDVMEYKVGPLTGNPSDLQIEELRKDGEIPFNSRPYDSAEYSHIYATVRNHFTTINPLLEDSFAGASFQTDIRFQYGLLPSLDTNDRRSNVYLYLKLGGYPTVRILPVTCVVHHPGVDYSTWYASDFYYASQGPFDSGQEMLDAYNAGTLRNITYPPLYRILHQTEFDLVQSRWEPFREHSDIPPPRTYPPEGVRYSISGHRVKWMDWEFEFSSNPMRGPAIFDVKFKKKRIAFEISLQDVTLLYSSQTNGAGPPALSDTGFLLGNYNAPVYGLDCPKHGTIIQASKFLYGNFKEIPAACVFEADGQRPLWRNKKYGLADHHLILRVSMNLGNYDYAMDFKFKLDGSLETLLSASGFLFGAFWDPNDPYLNKETNTQTLFGYRIADYLLGPIHDHNYLFKIDLDIEGRNNSFETRHWRTASTLEAFQTQSNVTKKPGYFYFNNTRYIEYETHEEEASFLIDPLKPKEWSVVNENERNKWGNKRGYRIIPYTSSAEILQEHTMLNAWDNLNFTFAVTKYKSSEQHGTTSWYDLQSPKQAFGGVGRMLNGESIRHEDLVVWMNYKFMHIPSAEDIPMTLSQHGGFIIKPYNYFNRTPVFDVQSHLRSGDPYQPKPCYES
ncbi:hypothetical protein ACF0H5_021227 [Mactra antiquata]